MFVQSDLPLPSNIASSASGSEWRLYDYITRHFISSLMPDVQYEEKASTIKLSSAFGFPTHFLSTSKNDAGHARTLERLACLAYILRQNFSRN